MRKLSNLQILKFSNPQILLLHLSFLLVTAGALCTCFSALHGHVVLRPGDACRTVHTGQVPVSMPFELMLDTFYVECYPGTDTPSDYISRFTVRDLPSGSLTQGMVSMNKIFTHRGYRFYQSSFDDDRTTSVLSVNRDVWGIPVVYAGYALFLLSMIGFLLLPGSAFRRLLAHPALRKTATAMLAAMLLLPTTLSAEVTTADKLSVSRSCAADIGRLWMLHNGRIAPVAVFARDFTLKITGKTAFGPLNADQFLAGFLFFPDRWQRVALFDVKDAELKKLLNAETEKAAWMDFYDAQGNYKLDGYRKDLAARAPRSPRLKEVERLDDRIQSILLLDGLRNALLPLRQAILSGDEKAVAETLRTISDIQRQHSGTHLPSDARREAELFYMKYNFTPMLFKVNLAAGILALLSVFLPGRRTGRVSAGKVRNGFYALLIAVLLVHTLSIALRTYISGRLPFGNGHETMLLMAWCAIFTGAVFGRRAPLLVPFSYLLSGCALLVAWTGTKNPQITHLVPVLSSPLLNIHVSTVMLSYTLFGFMTLNSLAAIVRMMIAGRKNRPGLLPYLERQKMYGLVCLYPALLFLGAGIITGSVWANVSWGRYWSWDPKEIWALITFLVYSLPVHQKQLRIFSNPLFFHIFSVLSFLTVLMTYFGVNYFLGGLHSYGG
ncbi:MAG: cytochrome c biogenesis protein CcsA [Tannerella sp.]|jgi:cytochrome c-type biogenesis protein CcsB|nr:cytochrome c biogenesis protein CcsA [Tannerella sp.]